jgi:hypothetical protein
VDRVDAVAWLADHLEQPITPWQRQIIDQALSQDQEVRFSQWVNGRRWAR